MPYNLLNDQDDHLGDMSCTRIVETPKPMSRAPSVSLKRGRVDIACTRTTEKRDQERRDETLNSYLNDQPGIIRQVGALAGAGPGF